MAATCFIISLLKTIIFSVYLIFKSWILFFAPIKCLTKKVTNEIVLITGAGSGLGAALAVKFAKQKARLILWDINEYGLKDTMEQCRQYQSELCIFTFQVDVTNRKQVLETAEKIKSSIGSVDILINNAGIVNGKWILDSTPESVEKTFRVNVISHFWTVQAFLPEMLSRNSGQIVSIASLAGFCGANKLADYSASKYAAIGFQETLMNELRVQNKTGIVALTVCPFYINTGMFDGVQADCPLLKILDVDYAASQIEEAILTNANFLMLPRISYILVFLKSFMPVEGFLYLADFVGANKSMDSFLGRR